MNQLLPQLSPAESLYLLEGPSPKFHQLLKVTLFDLLLKDVLRTRTVDGESGHVQGGPNLHSHAARPHELPFLEFLRKYPESALEIKTLVKTIRQQHYAAFKKRIEQNTIIKRFRLEGFWARLFSSTGLNDEGVRAKELLRSEVAVLGINFTERYNQSPDKALELLKQVNGNIFLCKDVDLSILNELQQLYPKEAMMASGTDNGSDITMLYAGCGGGFFDYSHHSSDLDASGCSGHGDSGCSGDSGGDGGGGCSGGCGGGCGGGD